MNAASHQLPLPVGTRFSAPTRRVRVDIWSAPDPSALVIDPWAAPLGPPIAEHRVSPWSPPPAQARVEWMAAPPALLPPPVLATVSMEAAASTERALSTLRRLAASPEAFIPPVASDSAAHEVLTAVAAPDSLTLDEPVTETMERIGTIDPLRDSPAPLPPPDPAALSAVDGDPTVRWRVLAAVAGVGAAAAATVALLANFF